MDSEEQPHIKDEFHPQDSNDSFTVGSSTKACISGLRELFKDDPGVYEFSVYLGDLETPKNRWTYSEVLGKLFIVWNQVIPLEFKWTPEEPNLLVRALPVYTEPQHVLSPVLRCRVHSDTNDPTNEGFAHIFHVIRSDNPGVIYDTDPETGTSSVLVPLGELQPGTGTVTVTYKFMCKSSCSTGMMRRPIIVLLNLERPNGEIVGRQSLAVKICSCPRRDMDKEEDLLRVKAMRKFRNAKGKRNFQFDMKFSHQETFFKILEFNHGIATSLLRSSKTSSQNRTELGQFLRLIETKLQSLK